MSDGYDFAVGIEGGPFLAPTGGWSNGIEGGLYGEGSIGAGDIRFRLGLGFAESERPERGITDSGRALSGERTFTWEQARLSLLFSPRFLQSPRDPGRFHAALYGGLDLQFVSDGDRWVPAPSEGDFEPISHEFNGALLGGILALEGRLPLAAARLLLTGSGWVSVSSDGHGAYNQAGMLVGLRYEL